MNESGGLTSGRLGVDKSVCPGRSFLRLGFERSKVSFLIPGLGVERRLYENTRLEKKAVMADITYLRDLRGWRR